MPNIKSSKFIGLATVTAVVIVLPFVIGRYPLTVLTLLLINIIAVVSFRFITTIGGWSLAHIVLMGLGAYASAIYGRQFGLSFWATLPLAVLSVGLVALALSYPLVKIKGFAFFIASFAAGEAIRLTWVKLFFPFGGVRGIINIPTPQSIPLPGLQTIDFGRPIPYYFLTLGLTALCLAIMWQLENSRIGDTFKAIYSDDSLAKSVGINVAKYKTLAFVIGSMFAAVAGVLYGHYFQSIDPTHFGFLYILYLLVWVVFGGYHTFFGPIIGVAILTGVYEALRPWAVWTAFFYGMVLIFTLIFLREGLEGVPRRIAPWFNKMRLRARKGY